MFSRRLSKGVVVSLAASSILMVASAAWAETIITPNTVNIRRTVALRPNTTTSMWISRSDCLANDVLTFPVVARGYVGTLEVWASNGASCLPPEARNSTAAQCWRVFSGAFTQSVFSVPIRVQDIAAMRKPPLFPDSMGDEASCTPAGGASPAQPITLFFMDILGDQNQGGSSWQTKLDLVGPQPPSAPLAPTKPLAVGNTLLIPAWTATGDIDVAGYDFFCAPLAGDAATAAPATGFGAGAGDAATTPEAASASTPGGATCSDASADGAASDAADDACTTGSSTTPSYDAAAATTGDAAAGAVAVASCGPIGTGVAPTADQLNLLCGTVTGATATSFTITGLTNDVEYEVAIGAVDAVGNVGPLGLANCAKPQVTVGFPENWHNAGGTAGGGFCSVSRVLPRRAGWSWGMGTILGLGMALRRRRRPQASN